jgi:DNA-binding HxlR family transcriptional regulator
MDSSRAYPHFCMAARALEEVGERWSLLVVRDLMLGPRRFTDLARTLGGITPTRLTDRLRSLEAAGIVVRERPTAGREVWYRLTEAGRNLEPVVDALAFWGMEHAFERPRAGEALHPDHIMHATKVWLDHHGVPPKKPVTWVWRFPGDEHYTIEFDGSAWTLARGEADGAAVTVTATPMAWGRFLLVQPDPRRLPDDGIEIDAKAADMKVFARAYGAAGPTG